MMQIVLGMIEQFYYRPFIKPDQSRAFVNGILVL